MFRHFVRIFLFMQISLQLLSQNAESIIIDKIESGQLSNRFISALFQDKKGYLWLGTIGGLNKYNGYGFKSYHTIPHDTTSISNPAITCFQQSGNDEILIGTRKGLNVYSYETDLFTRYFSTEKSNSASNNVNCLVTGIDGRVYIGTANGVFLFNKKERSFKRYPYGKKGLLEDWSVSSMCVSRSGEIWIGAKHNDGQTTINRVFRLVPNKEKLIEITATTDPSSEHKGISEDYLGNIWVGLNSGLACINPQTNKISTYNAPEGFYSNVSYFHTRDNVIWQCYWSFGLTSFDIDKKEFKIYRNDPDNQNSLLSNKCWALFKDDNGILWIGTDVGLQKITGKRPGIEIIRKNSKKQENSLPGNIITALYASRKHNDVIYAGCDGKGFTIYNTLTRKFINFGPEENIRNEERFVNQFIEDENGDVYVLGQNNFQKLSNVNSQPKAQAYLSFQSHYCACGIIDPNDKKKIWIGGKGEIMSFNTITQTFSYYPKPENIESVFYTVFSSGKELYFGYKNGLLKYNPTTNKFSVIQLHETGNIRASHFISSKKIILSAQYFGLIEYDLETGKYEIVQKNKNEYFPETDFILSYKNHLWFSSSEGAGRFDLETKEFTQITPHDGLPSPVIHKADLHNGYFYLGTHEGIAIMNPDLQVSHYIEPKIDITEITCLTDNKKFINLKNSSSIELNENQNSLRIDFTVLDFNLPEKNRYKFRLLPLEKEWKSPIGENFLIFNSLPAGTYQFELLGCNADQIWSNEPFRLTIKIVPPFYKTTWFYILFIAVIVAGVAIYIYLKIKSDHKRQELLERIIKERTAEIQHQKAELLDSIEYARRIQKAIFVSQNELFDQVKNSFIYYKPKDKLSGDVYWIGRYKDVLVVFSGDCTGHGVPGAMLSIIATSILNKVVHEENVIMPGDILTRLNNLFFNQLSLGVENVRDGMDASVLTINLMNKNVFYAGARQDAVMVVDNVLTELKSGRISIGEAIDTEYKTVPVALKEDRTFYLFSDGMKDQHGGPDNKKLGSKRFKEILHQASALSADEQKSFIYKSINDWMGVISQTDDMMLIGLKI